MCSQPEALRSLHRLMHCKYWDLHLFRTPCMCVLQTPFLEGFQENRNRVSLSSCLGTYFLVWRLKLYLIPYSHREASRTVLRNKPGFLYLPLKNFVTEPSSMCFLFMFFEHNDPIFTTSFFFLKYCDQQVNPSHSEKDHYLFINYELFISHYLLLNLQKQAEGHTTIGLCACDLFTKAAKKK